MTDKKIKVFISMPFTGKTFEALTKEREDLHTLAAQHNLELPEQFIGYQFEEDFKTKDYDPSFILAKDKKWIKESDIIVADFSAPSLGTACEITIAKELYDKEVIGIVPDVEKRKHTWLRFYCDHFASSYEEAFILINDQYAGYNHPEHVDKRQYDSIAVEYQLVEATPMQKYVYDPNASAEVEKYAKGGVVGVFHSASGHRARIAKEAGAAQVIGIDTSFRQISLAREIELRKKQGIEYLILNAYSKDFNHEFPEKYLGKLDLVLGFFLVDHAQTKIELTLLAQNIYASLKAGGTFVAMIEPAGVSLPTDPKYGVALEPADDVRGDGAQRKVAIYQNMKDGEDRPVLHFFNFEWERETIQKAFQDAGFSSAEFSAPLIAGGDAEKLGKDYWAAYHANPFETLFTCKK